LNFYPAQSLFSYNPVQFCCFLSSSRAANAFHFSPGVIHSPPGIQEDYIGFRTLTYKYVKYAISNEKEFYNLINDPFEMENQYLDLDLEFREQLDNYLAALQSCIGDTCGLLEEAPPQLSAPPGKEGSP
jgi:hypothetical protein